MNISKIKMLPKNTCGENGKNLKTPIVIENESTGKKDSSRLIYWNCIGVFLQSDC